MSDGKFSTHVVIDLDQDGTCKFEAQITSPNGEVEETEGTEAVFLVELLEHLHRLVSSAAANEVIRSLRAVFEANGIEAVAMDTDSVDELLNQANAASYD